MNETLLDQIVETVLYEGSILYPYRPSAIKNKQRFTFGRVYPATYSEAEDGVEPCLMQTECLATSAAEAELEVSVRFLHPMLREIGRVNGPWPRWNGVGAADFQVIPELEVNGKLYQTWQEAVERRVYLPKLRIKELVRSMTVEFAFGATRETEPLNNAQGEPAGVLVRRRENIEGTVEVAAKVLESGLVKLTVRVRNQTPMTAAQVKQSEAVLLRTMTSTHTILQLRGAEFVSLLEPPTECKEAASGCVNLGTWPVLVGDQAKGERQTVLSSPIILYDYPQIAPESPGSFFDGTEVDELLALRVRTLTDREKQEMRSASEEARRLLERTESLSQADMLRMHGACRQAGPVPEDPFGTTKRLSSVTVQGVEVRVGDRVRLKPKARADILDLALNERIAVIEALEEDFENRVHVAVVLENDPGKDLGLLRQPGHRFFYGVDEVEPLVQTELAEANVPEAQHG